MATQRPSTVVIKAVEMPLAIVFGSPAPNSVMAWNVSIMPITVPSSPINGATTEITWMMLMLRVNAGISERIASPSLSDSVSVSTSRLSWYTLITRPRGLSSLGSPGAPRCRFTLAPTMVSTTKRSMAMSTPMMPTMMMTEPG